MAMSKTRRQILKGSVIGAIGAPFISRISWAQGGSPMQRVQLVAVGAGGQGGSDIRQICSHPSVKLVAVADVDKANAAGTLGAFPETTFYNDWREMFRKEEFDSVLVSTPDHMHSPVVLRALAAGKHVYGQKPLAGRIKECRAITEAARAAGVVTQMGNQLASSLQERLGVELVRAGAIGKVKEVHVFSFKNWGDDNPRPDTNDPIPEGLDWEGWCGVSAKPNFINGYYHPGNWRKRQDYGTGCLGDMGCHIFNPVFRALSLTTPLSVLAESGVKNAHSWAEKELVKYQFAGTDMTEGSSVPVTWYGGASVPIPEEVIGFVPAERRPGQGSLFIGTEGKMLCPHGDTPSLWPTENFVGYAYPKIEPRDHYHEFIDCVIGKQKEAPISNFDYAGPATEAILLGCVASLFAGQKLEWDAAGCKVTNVEEANAHLEIRARAGWDPNA
jgi:predicted dehydrogenase